GHWESRRLYLLRRNLQNLFHLLVPISPTVIAGQFAIFVRNFLLQEHSGQFAIWIEVLRGVFSPAIEIKIGKRGNTSRRQRSCDFKEIVRFARVAAHWSKEFQEWFPTHTAHLFFAVTRDAER